MIRSRSRSRGGGGEQLPTNGFFSDDSLANAFFVNDALTTRLDAFSSNKFHGDTVVALFGDSLEQHNGTGSITAGSAEYSNWSRGYYNWCRILDPRGRWINWYDANRTSKFFNGFNQGISGNETGNMLARITDLTNIPNLKVAIIGGGTNDINGSTANQQIQDNLEDIFTAVKAVGAKIIYLTPPPRATSGSNSWASGSQERIDWMAFCVAMQAVADADPTNIKIVRRDRICSNDDADFTPIAEYLNSDNVHFAPKGAYAVAVGRTGWPGLNDTLAEWVNSFTSFPAAATTGDISPNPTLTGTGGTTGTSATGTVATSMRVQRVSGSTGVTAVASKETIDGIEYQKIVFTCDGLASGGNNAVFNLDRSGNIAVTQAGRWYRGWMQFKADASPLWEGISLRARGQPSTPANMDSQSMKTDTALLWPNVAFQSPSGGPLWQSTPPLQLKDGTTSVLWSAVFTINNQAAGTLTVWVSRMQLIPVPDPHPQIATF